MKSILLLAIVCIFAGVNASSCSTDPFGDAGLYNLYSLSTVNGCQSDVQGRVAAHGAVFLENYDVGLVNQVNEWYSLVCKGYDGFDM